MTGDPKVLSVLQAALSSEAHVNMQCRLDQHSLKFMGAKKTAKKIHKLGDAAHKHQKCVTTRLLLLGGSPVISMPDVKEQETLTSLLTNQLALEVAAMAPYEQAVEICRAAMDDGSRNLFEHLIKWKQKWIGWLEIQLNLIKGLGESEYLAEKL